MLRGLLQLANLADGDRAWLELVFFLFLLHGCRGVAAGWLTAEVTSILSCNAKRTSYISEQSMHVSIHNDTGSLWRKLKEGSYNVG